MYIIDDSTNIKIYKCLNLQCLDTITTALEEQEEANPSSILQFIGICSGKCFKEPAGPVYGNKMYAVESALCSAALHAGVCTPQESACEVFITLGGPQISFYAENKNGIVSMTHGPADTSIAISHASCTHALLRQQPFKLNIHFEADRDKPLPPVRQIQRPFLRCTYTSCNRRTLRAGWQTEAILNNSMEDISMVRTSNNKQFKRPVLKMLPLLLLLLLLLHRVAAAG